MADYPGMMLWTDAYLADTFHLTPEQHGYYLLLLMLMWRSPNQHVPNDDEWLANHLRVSVEQVQKIARPLIKELCQSDGNWITQKRLIREWSNVTKSRRRQSVRAKSRWHNNKKYAAGMQHMALPPYHTTKESSSTFSDSETRRPPAKVPGRSLGNGKASSIADTKLVREAKDHEPLETF